MRGEAGVMAREVKDTMSVLDPLTDPMLAVMIAVPALLAVASPVLLMAAMVDAEEFQVTELAKSRVLPSLKAPVAANCCELPKVTARFTGLTAMETTAAGVTVSPTVELRDFSVAVTVPVPTDFAAARPVLLSATTPDGEEVHVAKGVRS